MNEDYTHLLPRFDSPPYRAREVYVTPERLLRLLGLRTPDAEATVDLTHFYRLQNEPLAGREAYREIARLESQLDRLRNQ